MRIQSFEPSVHRPVKDYVARGHDRAAPHGELLSYLPNGLGVHGIPSGELAAMSARARIHLYVRPNIRRARDVIRLDTLHFVTQIIMRDVLQVSFRRESRRLPVLCARRR